MVAVSLEDSERLGNDDNRREVDEFWSMKRLSVCVSDAGVLGEWDMKGT